MFIHLTIVSTGYYKSVEGWGLIRRVEHLWMGGATTEGWSIYGWTGYAETGTVNKLAFLHFLGSCILNNSFILNDPELC